MLQLLLVLTTAISGPVAPIGNSAMLGGPDAYGYMSIDNDSGVPGSPVYRWEPAVRASGTQIIGLADDNVLGPFPIGFEFPYYWYRTTSIFMQSNGFITFGDPTLDAAPFVNLPSAALPNNCVAPLMSDMDFSRSGSPAKAFVWTNAAMDTFIAEYDSLEFWHPAGSSGVVSFQIVLSRADSAITFMYQKLVGTPEGGFVAGNNTTGIENVTGGVGISYLYGNLPARNAIHDTLAVRFFPPAASTMQVHDAAVWRVLNEDNGGVFLTRSFPSTVWAKVKNTGNQPETNILVAALVRNAANAIVYADTAVIPASVPGQTDSIIFDPPYTPASNGRFTTRVNCNLTGDMFRPNDTGKIETRVVQSPANLMYDDGTPSSSMYWNGSSGGFGNVFVAPAYPCTVTVIRAMMNYNTAAVGCTLWLRLADGPNGTPGTVLDRKTVQVASNTATWYYDTLATPVEITSGKFFVCVNSGGASEPGYGQDSTSPISRRSWEYTGSWSPSRDADVQDVMMNATVRWQAVTGVQEEMLDAAPVEPVLKASPNPFGRTTTIAFGTRLLAPTKLFVYSTTGELVRVMNVSGASANWDGRNYLGRQVAEGVYFAKLMTGKAPALKVILSK
jgi:hypothetical protein